MGVGAATPHRQVKFININDNDLVTFQLKKAMIEFPLVTI